MHFAVCTSQYALPVCTSCMHFTVCTSQYALYTMHFTLCTLLFLTFNPCCFILSMKQKVKSSPITKEFVYPSPFV